MVFNSNGYKYIWIKLQVAIRSIFLPKPKNEKIAICAIFQNDAAFLKEWLDFHFAIGVDHFFLYNDRSQDDYKDVLAPYIEKGRVTLQNALDHPVFLERMVVCYNDCLFKNGSNFKWITFLDTDEFIIPKKAESLKGFLRDYEDYPGVFINWLIFGTSGIEHLNSGEYLIEKMVYRCPDEHEEHLSGKTIMQPSSGMLFYRDNPHYPEYSPFNRMVFADKSPFVAKKGLRKICLDKIQLNHYWYRTERFYQQIKIPRRIALEGKKRESNLDEWHRKRANSTYDGSALKFMKNFRKKG